MRRSVSRAACSILCAAAMLQWSLERAVADSGVDAAVDALHTDCAGGMAMLTKLADGGDPQASLVLGLLYSKQARKEMREQNFNACPSLPYDSTKEISWYTKAADAGLPDAFAALAFAYTSNIDLPSDAEKATVWNVKAAALGSKTAQTWLLSGYEDGTLPLPTDQATLQWISSLANSFNGTAMTVVGMFLEAGIDKQGGSAAKDPKMALGWYEAAAKAGDAEGADRAGMMLFTGNEVTGDTPTADKYLEQAAQAGIAEAQQQLGYAYEIGGGIGADPAQSFNWYLKAAQRGYTYSEAKVAADYQAGTGVSQDEKQAAAWASPAADAGSALGEYVLGKEYLAGIAMPTDDSLGQKWLQKSADQGYAPAQDLLQRIQEAEANPMGNVTTGTDNNQMPTAQQFLGALALFGMLAATSHLAPGTPDYTPPTEPDNTTEELEQLQQIHQDEADEQQRQEEEQENSDQEMEQQQQQEMQQYNAEQGIDNGN
jgi:TPR repeat protein